MSEGQLLTEEALSWIGHEYSERQVLITEQDIRRFGYASREPEETLTGSSPDGVAEAAPMFYVMLRNMPYQVAPLDQLDQDGTLSEELPPIPTTRGMAGEIEIDFVRPMRAGETLTLKKRIVDLVEKAGRSGPFVIITFVTECYDDQGELVLRERFGRVLR